jgi:heme/copper-type cytochrome/quinol oxidase subunit 3
MSLHNTKAIQQREDAQHWLRRHGAALDVSAVPSFGFGHRSLMWWGTQGLILIEGTVFALAVMAYFYLWSHADHWPPAEPPPGLRWGTLNTVLFLLSFWPAYVTKKVAEQLDLRRVRLWLTISTLASLVILAVRVMEFQTLNCRWDGSAYGSIVWMLIGLHTTHLVTDAWDTAVLNVLVFTGPLEGKRFVDVSENALYWYFVVFSWLPIYAVLYWAPRGA